MYLFRSAMLKMDPKGEATLNVHVHKWMDGWMER